MDKYKVEIDIGGTLIFEVEADSGEKAKDAAQDLAEEFVRECMEEDHPYFSSNVQEQTLVRDVLSVEQLKPVNRKYNSTLYFLFKNNWKLTWDNEDFDCAKDFYCIALERLKGSYTKGVREYVQFRGKTKEECREKLIKWANDEI
jgi:hypothetical protein